MSALPATLYQELIKVIQPMLLGKLIEYFERSEPIDTAAVHEAYMCAAGISLSAMFLAVLHHLYFYHVQRAGMKIRVAMCHMIYRKVRHCVEIIPVVFITWYNSFVLHRLCILTTRHLPKRPQDRLSTLFPMTSTDLMR